MLKGCINSKKSINTTAAINELVVIWYKSQFDSNLLFVNINIRLFLIGILTLLTWYSYANCQSLRNLDFMVDSLIQKKVAEIDSLKLTTESQIFVLKKELSHSKNNIDSITKTKVDTLMLEVQKIDEQISLIENSFFRQQSISLDI